MGVGGVESYIPVRLPEATNHHLGLHAAGMKTAFIAFQPNSLFSLFVCLFVCFCKRSFHDF